jgi:hypothetical protein
VRRLFENRLQDAQSRLEHADEKGFKHEQGRIEELRFLLGLEGTAKVVLDKARSRSRITAVD